MASRNCFLDKKTSKNKENGGENYFEKVWQCLKNPKGGHFDISFANNDFKFSSDIVPTAVCLGSAHGYWRRERTH